MFDLISERNSFRADIARLGAERDAQRDRADSKQRGWDEANRQLDAMAAERDSLKAKLVEAEERVQTALVNATEARGKSRTAQAEAHLYDVALGQERTDNDFLRNQLRDLTAERDAAVQRAEAAEQTLALVEISENTQAADTERRVVEEIAEWLCRNFYPNLARLIKDGAYRKQQESKTTQGARDV